ncbi:MAG: hypothetical protein ABI382_08770 [Nakamurella sp.]
MRIRIVILLPAMVVLGLSAACQGSMPGSANSGVAMLSALAAQQATSAEDTTGPAAPLIDPCQALSKADVQPFFAAEVVTALPTLMTSDTEKSCEWAPTNKTSSLIVDYSVGDGAQTLLLMNRQPGSDAVAVPGVGDGASHPSGDPSLLFSWKGSGSTAVVCRVTTTGNEFVLVPDPSATLTDDQATSIDQQYGTLCNTLYRSGNTTPTVPTVSIASASALPSLTGTIPADSGATMPGSRIPLPDGVDCSGNRTTKDSRGVNCEQPITDPLAIYTYYLQALPAHGYAINSQQFWPASDGNAAHASVMFISDADGLCFILIASGKLNISKQDN